MLFFNYTIMKKFLTVLAAGYAIGVGLLMKKRKDEGKSKLADDASKTTLENVVDEIVDLHKTAFKDFKKFIHTNFDDVNDLDTLKDRVEQMANDFKFHAEKWMNETKNNSQEVYESTKKFAEESYERAKVSLQKAEEKAKTLGMDLKASSADFLDEAKAKIDAAYLKLKEKYQTTPESEK